MSAAGLLLGVLGGLGGVGVSCVALAATGLSGCARERAGDHHASGQGPGPIAAITPGHAPVGMRGLEHVAALAPGVYSGGEPVGEVGYASLRDLGVRTVISVDAVPPPADLARSMGIRVVHLPIGYDGVPESNRLAMAKALTELDGPVYVHCHHGEHRGPAALAAGAVCAGLVGRDEALAFMELAGTSHSYEGLWFDAERAEPVDPLRLLAADIYLPERADVGGYAGAMSLISRANDRVKLVAANGWRVPEDHPDLAPGSDLGLIHNLLRSLKDDAEAISFGPRHARLLDASIEAATAAERAYASGDAEAMRVSFRDLGASCKACHTHYRD